MKKKEIEKILNKYEQYNIERKETVGSYVDPMLAAIWYSVNSLLKDLRKDLLE